MAGASASHGKAAPQLAGADALMAAAPQQSPPSPRESFSMRQTFLELPWHVVPFLFGMFALVEALQQGGWVDFFAGVRHLLDTRDHTKPTSAAPYLQHDMLSLPRRAHPEM